MKVEKAKAKRETKGYVLYGNNPETGKWFERWYPTFEKAYVYAQKRDWAITVEYNTF